MSAYGRYKIFRWEGTIGGICIAYRDTVDDAKDLRKQLGQQFHGIEDMETGEYIE